MKGILLLTFVFHFSVSLAEEAARGDLVTYTTDGGFDRARFCEENAKKRIQELNQLSQKEIDKVKPLQVELNELSAKRNIMKSFLDLKTDYENSIKEIRKKYNNSEETKIVAFKKLLKSALVIEALKISVDPYDSLLKDKVPLTAEDENKKTNVDGLCKSVQKSHLAPQSAFCSYMSGWYVTGNASDDEREGINKVLADFRLAQSYLDKGQNEEVNKAFEKIYDSIPESITPEKVLNSLVNSGVAGMLNNSKETILKCLKDDFAACRTMMKDKRADVKTSFKDQLSRIQSEFASKKLDGIFEDYDKLAGAEKAEIKTESGKKLELAFQKAKEQKATLKSFSVTDENFSALKEKCSSEKLEDQQSCHQIAKELSEFFQEQTKQLNEQIAAKTAELNTLASTEGRLSRIEKMKNYVAQKYIRTCPNPNAKEVASALNPCSLSNESAIDPGGPEVAALNAKLSGIVGRIVAANQLSTARGEHGPFSRDELEMYVNYCKETSAQDFGDICKDVAREYNSIAGKKEVKDWDELHNKYWILPNEKNKNGYDVYHKKSNLKIFGEGLSQSVSRIYPTWFNNMNLKYQINTLESQALYMKQMNYMYNASSPWNMGFPYFQGNYYTYPTSTTAGSPFSTSAGFNFN